MKSVKVRQLKHNPSNALRMARKAPVVRGGSTGLDRKSAFVKC